MAEFYRLDNRIKHYDWGSLDLIPEFLGIPGNGKPCAELWMGSHPGAPSRVRLSGDTIGSLPYLLKLLAAEKPLSIQAHPSLEQARKGFARENKEGLALNAPTRNYRDPNHKPEILCALTPFTGMCGFRSPSEIARLIATFLEGPPSAPAPTVVREGLAPLLQALDEPDADSALRNFFAALFASSPALREALTEFILRWDGTEDPPPAHEPESCEWGLMRGFARQYPGDPAIIAPLYLNVFRLQPGEAIFLKASVLHAYIQGFGVELMASSDNVLRGGLTRKHVDVPELMKVLDFSPLELSVMKPEPGASRFTYPVSCRDFSLTVMRGTGDRAMLANDGPAICIVTEGEAMVGGESLEKGESIFVPLGNPGEKSLEIQGFYTLYIASTGKPV